MAETKKFYVVGENGAKSTPWGFSTFLEFDGLLWRIRKTVREGIANAEERRALLEHIRKVRRVLKHISENPEEWRAFSFAEVSRCGAIIAVAGNHVGGKTLKAAVDAYGDEVVVAPVVDDEGIKGFWVYLGGC